MYFHQLVNDRRNKTFIPRIRYNIHWVEENQVIGKVFTEHFQLQFGNPITQIFLRLAKPFLLQRKLRSLLSRTDILY